MIVLKHHKHYKREIFTLAHELGHCLLGIEEVESVDMMDISAQTSYSDVEDGAMILHISSLWDKKQKHLLT